ncbi:hypothetical protein EZ428_17445 [Pedobacter frigiditerrae]|uniref:Uncharacterized protein n=1 Tax=Pedobacter frigiditerrae TaxID=2530452 RepID=A0A4V6N5P7_9SPHI|nr:hypothetical protein [Pedobacter frigiditerrae]TCC89476.1 hypothetical protein EZ428_17445 [Pedobacter frigiditerrae]
MYQIIIKHRFKFLCILLLFITNITFAQTKPFEPKMGSIFLVKENRVIDSKAFEETFNIFIKEFIKGLKDKMVKEYKLANKPMDTLQLNEIAAPIKELLFETISEPGKKSFAIEYKADKIFYTQLDDENNSNELYYFDKLKNIVINSFNQSQLVDYFRQEQIISIKEYREQTKIIQGYKCFKVIYQYKENSENEEIFMPPIVYTRELWVTEQLKSPFHFAVKANEILSKYYPLEIVEHIDKISGLETTYILTSINLK